MTIETIYNELKEINKELQVLSIRELMEKMEVEIRKETCYKTTSKTRIDAIKRVASKMQDRPSLTGYGMFGEYKGVTDSYHAILIKQDEMPLPLVATKSDLESLGIDYKEYMEKHGSTSLINGTYPNLMNVMTFDFDKSNELTLDVNDLLSFIKLNKKDDKALYKLGECYYQAKFIKNVIDVLGKDAKIYFQGELKPLYFINKDDEIGLVLPVKKY